MSYPQHLREVFRGELERWIARSLPFVVRRSLRRGLHAVWARGMWETLPAGGAVLAANHHSWWDAYLAWLVQQRLGREVSGMMREAQLETFPFFRRLGVISDREVREALRRLSRGHLLFIFPEGALKQTSEVGTLQRGAAFLAQRAEVPIFPLAIRVVMRGAQQPEAVLSLGEKLEPDSSELLERVGLELNRLLSDIDHDVATARPEEPLTDYTPWLTGRRSFNERVSRLKDFWT